MTIFRRMRTRDPDAEQHELQQRFRTIANRYDRRQKWLRFFRSARKRIIVGAVIVVCAIDAYMALVLFSPWPPLVTLKHFADFPNCNVVRALDLAPAKRGEPGYWPWHDRDKDGIACEPVPSWKLR